MNSYLLLAYLGTVLILIATPGPVVALVVGTSSRAGAWAGMRTALGANAASLILIGAAAAVLAGSLALSNQLLNWVALFGCLFMGWLGIEAWLQPAGEPTPAKTAGGWWQGFLVGITNPKDILFFVALFPQFIQVTNAFGTSIGVLALVWLVVDLGILALYIGLMRHARVQKYRHRVARLSGLVLMLIAACGVPFSVNALLAG